MTSFAGQAGCVLGVFRTRWGANRFAAEVGRLIDALPYENRRLELDVVIRPPYGLIAHREYLPAGTGRAIVMRGGPFTYVVCVIPDEPVAIPSIQWAGDDS